ncbi:MAG: hypothetical protein F7B17_08190 [Desulfurococcales archaeon]|nr:hypothetical protein [Desulfurococcales archaeon]
MGSGEKEGEAEAGRGALFIMVLWAFLLVIMWVSIFLIMVSRGLYSGA